MYELTMGLGFFLVMAIVLGCILLAALVVLAIRRIVYKEEAVRGQLLGERYTPELVKNQHPQLMPKEVVRRSERAEAKRAEQQYRKPDYDDEEDEAMQTALRSGHVDTYKGMLDNKRKH